jgi:hypothetical protein
MRSIMLTVLACLAWGTQPSAAADSKNEGSDRARVLTFLKEHVIGKTVVTAKTTFTVDGNKQEGEYEDQTSYTNLTETEHGLAFDVTTVMKQTRYDLDREGKRLLPGRDVSGTEVYRYELCERASTKKLTGISRPLSRTTRAGDPEGTVILVTGVKVANGNLTWNETLPGYFDLIATQGKYRAGSWDGRYTFLVVEGKLRTEYEETARYDVDPDTLKRTPRKDKIPVFIANETDQK